MLGAIIGDICGSVYEFDNCKDFDRIELFADGCSFTDDTVMTIAVAQALMDADNNVSGRFDTKEELFGALLPKSMRYYGEVFPYAGYGGRFATWLQIWDPKPYNSYGNGSAMRVSSVGWAFNTLEETLRFAEISAAVTHNHPEGIKGAKAVAGAVFLARNGADKKAVRDIVEGLGYDLDFTIDEIRPSYRHDESCQNSVPQGIKCFLESTDFEQCIRLTLSLGGDCDTTAAMSGAIAEAFYGVPDWMKEEALKRLPEPMYSVYMRFDRWINGINRFAFLADWTSDKETILMELKKSLISSFSGTLYYFERNSSVGERCININYKGETRRVGSIWPHNNKMIYDVVLRNDIFCKVERYMNVKKENVDYRPEITTYKNLNDEQFIQLMNAMIRTADSFTD